MTSPAGTDLLNSGTLCCYPENITTPKIYKQPSLGNLTHSSQTLQVDKMSLKMGIQEGQSKLNPDGKGSSSRDPKHGGNNDACVGKKGSLDFDEQNDLLFQDQGFSRHMYRRKRGKGIGLLDMELQESEGTVRDESKRNMGKGVENAQKEDPETDQDSRTTELRLKVEIF